MYHSVSVVGTLLLQIGEVGHRVKLQRSASVLGAGGDAGESVSDFWYTSYMLLKSCYWMQAKIEPAHLLYLRLWLCCGYFLLLTLIRQLWTLWPFYSIRHRLLHLPRHFRLTISCLCRLTPLPMQMFSPSTYPSTGPSPSNSFSLLFWTKARSSTFSNKKLILSKSKSKIFYLSI